QRARLAQTEVKVPKKTLTLPHSEDDFVFILNKCRQGLSIPYMPSQTEILWTLTQSRSNLIKLFSAEPSRSSWPRSINQTSKAFFFKAMNPVLNRAWCIAQELGHLTTAHTLSHQQQSVKAVVVSRLLRTADLILQREDHDLGIRDLEFSHAGRVPPVTRMRNYLCR